ncbi:interleukin-1 receptor-like 2 [Clarias gariepinus]|uniref:interleukin-1 receptor-like 2 n=1 Tax=Clarias gariepinus TaxID=13013 RepID=UPI00234E2A1F|nr:interleukin-1 receptor-like 2 [Clarias gariepinus]XP_053352370.1 interleukin-1 receptor-like 2 [Clarias gariepinus]
MLRWCRLLLILSCSLHSGGCMGTKRLELTAGHVYNLNCLNLFNDKVVSVNWTRELNQEWDVGLKIIDGSLLFLPVQESHSGNYSCYYRFSDTDEHTEKNFSISVTKHKCPREPDNDQPVYLMKNAPSNLPCYSDDVMNKFSKLGSVSVMSWTWMKDCSPLSWQDESKLLRFGSVSEGDRGVYTCVLNFTLNGTSYTMVQSKQVIVTDPGPVPQKPRIIKPRQETLAVKLGSKLVLNCKVFVGLGSCEADNVDPVQVYWLVNNEFAEDTFFNETDFVSGCTTENGEAYHHNNLTISEVKQEFFNINFQCVALTSYGADYGTVILFEQDQRELYCTLAVVTACVMVTLGVLLYYLFKVDLVLAYRNLSPCLKQQNDGKLYDAYVSYLHGNNDRVSSATTFALNVLPEVLEDQLGYKLFISGRDSIPGTAVHDVICETVKKSRRLIFVLPSKALTTSSDNEDGHFNKKRPKHFGFNNNIAVIDPDVSELSQLHWGPYECWVGLYDALVEECVQIILVQVGEDVDDALLPESLRYVKHTQGILKWKQHYARKPNGRFWKQMRYRMPPVQKARTAVIV